MFKYFCNECSYIFSPVYVPRGWCWLHLGRILSIFSHFPRANISCKLSTSAGLPLSKLCRVSPTHGRLRHLGCEGTPMKLYIWIFFLVNILFISLIQNSCNDFLKTVLFLHLIGYSQALCPPIGWFSYNIHVNNWSADKQIWKHNTSAPSKEIKWNSLFEGSFVKYPWVLWIIVCTAMSWWPNDTFDRMLYFQV